MRITNLTDVSKLDIAKVHTYECTKCNAITAHQIITKYPLQLKCLDCTPTQEEDEPVTDADLFQLMTNVNKLKNKQFPANKRNKRNFTDDE